MNFALTAEQTELKKAAARFLATHCASARVRAATESACGYDEDAWGRAARELGWASLVVPEAHGGAGLGWVELAVLMEEAGRSLACMPLLSTACLATNALLAAGSEAQQQAWLPRIAAGEATAALAFAEEPRALPLAIETTAARKGDAWELTGEKRYVVDGAAADVLVVTAREAGTSGDGGVAMFVVDATVTGVRRERVTTVDPTRAMATVRLDAARVPGDARMGDARALRRALDRAAVALAAESLGGAQRCLEMATEYAKARVQFNRPIGSFQAIKHTLADMLVAVETARSAAYYAAHVAQSGSDAQLAVAAPLAKTCCTEAFFRCAADNVQVHGGIGFTWEHDAHLYLKRARASLSLLGSSANDRERVADAIGL
jgi:alkylation response protein AidB-like acyl-CoA dehydrogenase